MLTWKMLGVCLSFSSTVSVSFIPSLYLSLTLSADSAAFLPRLTAGRLPTRTFARALVGGRRRRAAPTTSPAGGCSFVRLFVTWLRPMRGA